MSLGGGGRGGVMGGVVEDTVHYFTICPNLSDSTKCVILCMSWLRPLLWKGFPDLRFAD
jgi:hypothetical protein